MPSTCVYPLETWCLSEGTTAKTTITSRRAVRSFPRSRWVRAEGGAGILTGVTGRGAAW